MLKHLYISQYALIDELELALEDGFSVITGETGAGKSIIMGALALVMGARADSKSVREGAQKCIVEATFIVNSQQSTVNSQRSTLFASLMIFAPLGIVQANLTLPSLIAKIQRSTVFLRSMDWILRRSV